ncbi:MAG: 23S rRNA (uracil(1939)-C(5))-methyltransferase RlmD [Clostridia bacterium]|nr:23S rRNA (uracil(1939)-C(5))-methyltransferase RlmD [Clostridia bacterium]
MEQKKQDRQAQPCPYFPRCGGCSRRQVPYGQQLAEKTAYIRKLLAPFGVKAADCRGGKTAECRNKVHLAFTTVEGAVRAGFFDTVTHRVVPVAECPMHGAWYGRLVQAVEGWAAECRIRPYEPRTGRGSLRFVAARYLGGRLMVTVVSQEPRLPGLDKLHRRLEAQFGSVALWLNVNDRRDSAVFSQNFRHIAGEKKLRGEMLGVSFELSPDAFFQVNTEMAELLYTRILELAKERKAETVVDAYSGIGITSLLFAKAGMKVISVEQVRSAVEDTRAMAKRNGLDGRVRAMCGDCAKILPGLRVPEQTLFFVDPPRRGLGESVCRTILRFAPKYVLYLSCGPEALAQDLKRLTQGGYKVRLAEPYDLFPHTEHVETIVLLSREKADDDVRISVHTKDFRTKAN